MSMMGFVAGQMRRAGPSGDGDQYWSNVVHLLRFDGAEDGAVFTDLAGAEWTAYGTAKIVADAEAFGGFAGSFDGAGYISTPYDSERSIGGAEAFTIEAFVTPTALNNYQSLVGAWPSDTFGIFRLLADSAGRLRFDIRAGGETVSTPWSGAGVIAVGVRSYIAAVWTGEAYEIWRGGVQVARLDSSSPPQAAPSVLAAGINIDGHTWHARCRMDELRITCGVARDVSVVPTAPFPAY